MSEEKNRLNEKIVHESVAGGSKVLKKLAALPGPVLARERERSGLWLLAFFAVLGLLLLINIFARPEHPHFGFDSWWGFWAVFGLVIGLAMVFIMKRVIQPLIVRKEDYYGDL